MSAMRFAGPPMQCYGCGARKTSPALRLTVEEHPDGRMFGFVTYCRPCNPRREFYLARDAEFQERWDAAREKTLIDAAETPLEELGK